jgi:hypothetical protein
MPGCGGQGRGLLAPLEGTSRGSSQYPNTMLVKRMPRFLLAMSARVTAVRRRRPNYTRYMAPMFQAPLPARHRGTAPGSVVALFRSTSFPPTTVSSADILLFGLRRGGIHRVSNIRMDPRNASQVVRGHDSSRARLKRKEGTISG